MKTVELDLWAPRPDRIELLVRAVDAGHIVALPTDTTWAIVADPLQVAAAQKLTALRERMSGRDARSSREQPMSLLCGDLSIAGTYTVVDQPAFRLMKRLFPGPYTVLLPASRQVPRQLQTKRNTVGVRMPDHPIVAAVLERLARPLLVATARLPDGELLASSGDIERHWSNGVDLVVETDPIIPEASTVLDLTEGVVRVVRAGRGALEPDWELPEPDTGSPPSRKGR